MIHKLTQPDDSHHGRVGDRCPTAWIGGDHEGREHLPVPRPAPTRTMVLPRRHFRIERDLHRVAGFAWLVMDSKAAEWWVADGAPDVGRSACSARRTPCGTGLKQPQCLFQAIGNATRTSCGASSTTCRSALPRQVWPVQGERNRGLRGSGSRATLTSRPAASSGSTTAEPSPIRAQPLVQSLSSGPRGRVRR